MVSVLVSSEIDRRFETRSIGQLEDCTIGIFAATPPIPDHQCVRTNWAA